MGCFSIRGKMVSCTSRGRNGFDGDVDAVITSYSIHYTKLYEKVLLEVAIHERVEKAYPLSWSGKKLDEAERIVHELLGKRVIAYESGFP